MNVSRILAPAALLLGSASAAVGISGGGPLSAARNAPSVATCTPGESVTEDPASDYPPSCPTTTTTTIVDDEMSVEVLAPVCDHDVPYLTYEVTVTGTTATTATITFINPTGANYVVSGVPLAGRVLWPGAVVDASGQPVDWPGWTKQADGTWVPGDEWNWARMPITVLIEVNPSASRMVEYPPATPQCVAGPRTTTTGGAQVLPATR